MNPFQYAQAGDAETAIASVAPNRGAHYIAGGTNLLDLMKDDVERPQLLVDITQLPYHAIVSSASGVRIGALATMADTADAALVSRPFPVVAQALLAGASPQLRNMATIGGNIMQRTRCAYFRDVSQACNKRKLGLGCSAIGGENRLHAVIGTSAACICTHPSDLAVALLAVDATVNVRGLTGSRSIPIDAFHVLPGATPQIETSLAWGELIESIDLPASAHAQNSAYLKVRDRASYEFALVSVAAALEAEGGIIRNARLALGGVAPVPWRPLAAEAALVGKPATRATFDHAAQVATSDMRGYGKNDFKIQLTRNAIVRILETVGATA